MRACASGKGAVGAKCCLRALQQLGRAAWHECACTLAGGRHKAGALLSELGVVREHLFCEVVRLSASRSLQMPGGQNSPSTIRWRFTLRHRAEAWCGGGTGRKQDVAAFTVALGCWGDGGSVGQHVRLVRKGWEIGPLAARINPE